MTNDNVKTPFWTGPGVELLVSRLVCPDFGFDEKQRLRPRHCFPLFFIVHFLLVAFCKRDFHVLRVSRVKSAFDKSHSIGPLFSVALGATVVIPDMDPSHPADVDPIRIFEAVYTQDITYSFGSPTLWRKVSMFCVNREITFPSVKRVLMAGAPIPAYIHKRMLEHVLAEGAEIHTPYGATEALPIATMRGTEVLRETWEQTTKGGKVERQVATEANPVVSTRSGYSEYRGVDKWEGELP